MREYRDILIFSELEGTGLSNSTIRLLGKAREVADSLGARIISSLIGNDLSGLDRELIENGADIVYTVKREELSTYEVITYTSIIDKIVDITLPEIIIFASTYIGNDLAPRIAQRLNTGLVVDCIGLDIDTEDRFLIATRPIYQGRLIAEIVFPHHRPQIVTVRPDTMIEAIRDEYREGRVERLVNI